MKITWFANASILIEAGGERLLFDPFVPLKGAENTVTADDFGRDNNIFITHGHIDHMGSAGLIAGHGGSRIYCTATPSRHLLNELKDQTILTAIKPGDRFDFDGVSVTVHPGRHIEYDKKLIRRTVLSLRNFRYMKNAALLIRGHRKMRENNETVVYEVNSGSTSAVILGSLAILEGHAYPHTPDILTIPYQGHSDLLTPALRILGLIRPKAVLLVHFDDAFPPISRTIDTGSFEETVRQLYPDMKIIKPQPRQCIII